MSHETNEPLSEFEAALASLSPTAGESSGGIGRDRLMFLAGRAAAERCAQPRQKLLHALWPLTTAVAVLVALTFGGLLVHERQLRYDMLAVPRPEPNQSQSPHAVVADKGPAPDNATRAAGQPRKWSEEETRQMAPLVSYLRLRSRVLAEGVDVLPGQPRPPLETKHETLTPRSSLETFDG